MDDYDLDQKIAIVDYKIVFFTNAKLWIITQNK